MSNFAFQRPVTVLVGLGFPRIVTNVYEAFSCLKEVPTLMRDEVYEATCDACRDALSGKCSIDDAHDVFIAYARRRSILVEEPLDIAASGGSTAEYLPAA